MSEQAKFLATEYAINETKLASILNHFQIMKDPRFTISALHAELELAFEAGWKACERKDHPYDAMTEGQDDTRVP